MRQTVDWDVLIRSECRWASSCSNLRKPASRITCLICTVDRNVCVCVCLCVCVHVGTRSDYRLFPRQVNQRALLSPYTSGLQLAGCWFVGGNVTIGALQVLQLQLSSPSPSSLAAINSRMETFRYWFTVVVLENVRYTSVVVVQLTESSQHRLQSLRT